MQKLTTDEKEQKRHEHNEKRNRIESKMLGGYKIIFPGELDLIKLEKYKKFQNVSRDLFDYFTLGKKVVNSNLRNIREHE